MGISNPNLIPASGCFNGIQYKIEQRTWFSGGKYLGRSAKFSAANTDVLSMHLSGPAFGDEDGVPSALGSKILVAQVGLATKNRRRQNLKGTISVTMDSRSLPFKVGIWGEYRIVTLGSSVN